VLIRTDPNEIIDLPLHHSDPLEKTNDRPVSPVLQIHFAFQPNSLDQNKKARKAIHIASIENAALEPGGASLLRCLHGSGKARTLPRPDQRLRL
jgi:hypothetical protein